MTGRETFACQWTTHSLKKYELEVCTDPDASIIDIVTLGINFLQIPMSVSVNHAKTMVHATIKWIPTGVRALWAGLEMTVTWVSTSFSYKNILFCTLVYMCSPCQNDVQFWLHIYTGQNNGSCKCLRILNSHSFVMLWCGESNLHQICVLVWI